MVQITKGNDIGALICNRMLLWQKSHTTAGHRQRELQRERDIRGEHDTRAGEEGERNRKQKSEAEEARAHEDKDERNVTIWC